MCNVSKQAIREQEIQRSGVCPCNGQFGSVICFRQEILNLVYVNINGQFMSVNVLPSSIKLYFIINITVSNDMS